MYCRNCGAANRDGAKYCTSCGRPLPVNEGQKPAAQDAAQPKPAATEKKRDYGLLIGAVVALIVSIVNMRDMQIGESYVTLWFLPAHYLGFPMAAALLYFFIKND